MTTLIRNNSDTSRCFVLAVLSANHSWYSSNGVSVPSRNTKNYEYEVMSIEPNNLLNSMV